MNQSGLERLLPSNTETGSSEPGGVERKDAARRLTRAREPGHLIRLSYSHLTRQSREARWGTGTRPVTLFAAFPTKQPRACQDAGSRDGMSNQDPLETSKVNALGNKALHGVRPSTRHVPFLRKGWASTDNTTAIPTYQPP